MKKKILGAPLRISIAFLIVGMLFKIQHWPYANLIIVSAFIAIALLYSFRFGNKEKKILLDYIKLSLVVFWSVNGIFTILHLPYKVIFQLIASISFILWLLLEGISYFKQSQETVKTDLSKIISNGIFVVASMLTIAGIMFKIMHWPGAAYLLISGLLLGAICLLKV